MALIVLGSALWLAAPFLEGDRVPVVHVRWRPGLPDVARQAEEARLGLAEAERLDELTFKYALTDPSSSTVLAIVKHADVEDTHYINRERLALPADGPLSQRRYGIAQRLGLVDPARAFFAAALWCFIGGGTVFVVLWAWPIARRLRPREIASRLAAFLIRGIPACSAEGAALFRMTFLLLLIPVFAGYSLDLDGFAVPPMLRQAGLLADVEVVRWMLGQPELVVWFERALMLLMLICAAGLFGPWALVTLIAGLMWWMVLRSHIAGHHPLAVVLLTLFCLVPARWNDALTFARRPREILPPGPVYGYTVWIPTFVLGVACAAAAYAKLEHGPDWILNGTVRYHFMVDYPRARVDWGLWVAARPTVAVALSAAVVIIEAGLITAAFSRSAWYRMLTCACGLAVFVGFYLFQGERWLGWWLLFTGFLPWHLVSRTRTASLSAAPTSAPLPRVYLAIIVAVTAQQVIISALHKEGEPLFSSYDMYSVTYASPEDFDERTRDVRLRVQAAGSHGTVDATACLERAGRLDLVMGAAKTGVVPAVRELGGVVQRCYDGVQVDRLEVIADESGIDWDTGRFVERYRDRVVFSLPMEAPPLPPQPVNEAPYNRQ